MLQRTHLSWFLLAMLLVGVASLPLAAATAKVATTQGAAAPELNPAEVSPDKAATMEIKQTLVRFAQERNELKAANELLQNQSWLLIIYSVVMSLLSGWLGLRMLAEPTPVKRQNGNTDSFSANTTNTIGRKNATITVRNGTTQQPEVVEHAQTRKLFNGNHTASEARPTVRIERRPDGLDQAGIARGTGAVTRTKAFSLLEVMISVAVLATVLMAVMSSSYTLRQVQRSAKEQSQVEELTANLAERIMGANWEWIGRDRPNELGTTIDYKKGAWSWHRREQRWETKSSARVLIAPGPVNNPLREEPLSGQTTLAADDNLVSVGLLKEKTGIENLSVFVEYYRSNLLEDVFNATNGEAPSNKWRQYAPAGISDETVQVIDDNIYPQDENVMNLRDEAKAIIVRIVVTWTATTGGERRHELVFARRK